jgi:hypothetical protein
MFCWSQQQTEDIDLGIFALFILSIRYFDNIVS